jgi:ABC-2 type transport system permease protein
MVKTWLVARLTYGQHVRSGAFQLLTFGIPLMMIITGAIPFLRSQDPAVPTIGYVDESGQLPYGALSDGPVDVEITSYKDQHAAREAAETGDIDGYLIIPTGYVAGERPSYVAQESPSSQVVAALETALRSSILADRPEWVRQRAENLANVTYIAVETDERITHGTSLVIRAVFRIALAILLALVILSSVSQTGAAVVQEKEERVMEMIITSLAPWQLVSGKVLGMTMLSMTQVTIWATGGAVGLALVASGLENGLVLPWHALVWAILLGAPTYFFYAILAVGLGIVAGDRQHAQQLAGALGFLSMMPLWLGGMLISAPDGTLPVVLSLVPFTSSMMLLFRMAFTEIPAWQFVAAMGIVLVCLAISIYAVARILRVSMLLYGQRLTVAEIWRALGSS